MLCLMVSVIPFLLKKFYIFTFLFSFVQVRLGYVMSGWTRLLSLEECCISGFHHEVHENCALLGYYAISSGNSL